MLQPALLASFSELPESADASELDAALLVNRLLNAEVALDAVRAEINRLQPPEGEPLWGFLAAQGFRGDDGHYHDLANSQMDAVLARRRGIPITLAVLLISVAQARGQEAWGINAPGHFLGCVGGQVIDPFSMQTLQVDAQTSRATPVDIALRMLNNVKQIHLQSQDHARALDAVEAQLAMADPLLGDETVGALLLEKGEYWNGLGVPELAQQAYESALLRVGEDSRIGAVCQARLRQRNPSAPPTLH